MRFSHSLLGGLLLAAATPAGADGDSAPIADGWGREPELPVVTSLDDLDDDADLDIPDFLK